MCRDLVGDHGEIVRRGAQLGKGTYGTVFRACIGKGCTTADRVLRIAKYNSFEDFARYFAAFKHVQDNHPDLVPVLYAASWCNGSAYFVFERMDGDLSRLTPDERLAVYPAVRSILDKLHALRIVHHDVRDANLLFRRLDTPNGGVIDVRITDFDLATIYNSDFQPERLYAQRIHSLRGRNAVGAEVQVDIMSTFAPVYDHAMFVFAELCSLRIPRIGSTAGEVEHVATVIRHMYQSITPPRDVLEELLSSTDPYGDRCGLWMWWTDNGNRNVELVRNVHTQLRNMLTG